MNNNTWPNLFIAGAPRCGTTSLYEYLKVHPQIFGPDIKEPRYLTSEYMHHRKNNIGSIMTIKDEDEYLSLYDEGKNLKYRMDGTPMYMFYPGVIAKIRDISEDSRVIISIRNPIDREISAYNMLFNRGKIDLGFEEYFLNKSPKNKPYMIYSDGIKNMFDTLGRDRIHIIKFDDLTSDTDGALRKIYEFLGLEPIVPEIAHNAYNSYKKINKSNFKRKFMTGRLAQIIYPKLSKKSIKSLKRFITRGSKYEELVVSDSFKEKMLEGFLEDINKTEELTGFDLSNWKSV